MVKLTKALVQARLKENASIDPRTFAMGLIAETGCSENEAGCFIWQGIDKGWIAVNEELWLEIKDWCEICKGTCIRSWEHYR